MIRDSTVSKAENSNKDGEPVKTNLKKKQKSRDTTTDSSSTESSDSDTKNRHYDSDSDGNIRKPQNFGLVKSDGTKLALNKTRYLENRPATSFSKVETVSKPEKKNVKKLSEEEKEKLRREMMKNAQKREIERSDNLKRYREEDIKEEKRICKF
ncbi:hypothetical protein NQ317_012325 [Molorchus minor]|uniref:Uncharacterized protein n=1 Tax=Molorchus minor TaxID=1323400 RepID=A0ABQ9IUW9_9CUCU|nr:hypothetical protein NQ317_012325 [Molorchus minor]